MLIEKKLKLQDTSEVLSEINEKKLVPEVETIGNNLNFFRKRLEEIKPKECDSYRLGIDNLLQEMDVFLAIYQSQKDVLKKENIEESPKMEPDNEIDDKYHEEIQSFLIEAQELRRQFGPAIDQTDDFVQGLEERSQYKFLAEQNGLKVKFFDLVTKKRRANFAARMEPIKTWFQIERERLFENSERRTECTALNLAATQQKDPAEMKNLYLNQKYIELESDCYKTDKDWFLLLKKYENKLAEFRKKIEAFFKEPIDDMEKYFSGIEELKEEARKREESDNAMFGDFLKRPIFKKNKYSSPVGMASTQYQ